jgi:hypothetical protein
MNGLLSPNSAQNRIFLFSKFFETQSSADGPVGASSLPARPMEGFKIGRVAFAGRPGSRVPAEKAKSRLACKASPTESQSSNLLQLHLKLSSNIP